MPAPSSHRGALGRLLAACAIVFACCAAGVVAVGANELHATARALDAQPRVDLGGVLTSTTSGGPSASGNGRTILLIGSDHRAKTAKHNARSDTMMLVRLSPRAKAVTVLSIPRDLKVTIKGQTAKLNAAYAYGGAPLTVKTLSSVLGVSVDHVIDVDFAGFRGLVNELGCVYTDVDRRYFNRNDGTPATNFASIDVQAGYQRLCGADALDYVRYRHGDNDLVRAARQQDFLRQARAQIGVADLLGDRHALLRLLGENTRTDIRGSKQITTLTKLALDAADKPVQQVPFPATIGSSYVTATPAQIKTTVRRFLHPTVATAEGHHRDSRGVPSASRRPAPPGSWPPPRRRPSTPRSASSTPLVAAPARPTTASARTRSRTRRARATPPTGSRSVRRSASTTASRAPTGPTRRSSPPPTRSARSATARSTCTTTAATCGASRCARLQARGGSRTRSRSV